MTTIDRFSDALTLIWQQFLKVASYPLDPSQRIYGPYLFTSLLFAIGVYLVSGSRDPEHRKGSSDLARLTKFVFPRPIWRHPSSWVDVRYFIPHQMVRIWIYTSFATFITTGVGRSTYLGLGGLLDSPGGVFEVTPGPAAAIAYTVVNVVVIDFLAYVMHYFQHAVPILWQFHKVHHSAEVLNVSYAATLAIGTGTSAGVFQAMFGFPPPLIQILGINMLMFLFNASGYHLRHSHVWLRWPGPLAYLFGCPAHHQIHHSCRPEHINKNMAFMFPIWDVLFGTFYLPKEREELVFGIGDGTEGRYRSFLSLYLYPFAELFRSWRT